MATINVYTHYTHKLAWEKNRPRPTRTPRHWTFPAEVLGCLLALCLAWMLDARDPLALFSLASLGGSLTWTALFLRRRSRKFMLALQGRPLEADDLLSFRH